MTRAVIGLLLWLSVILTGSAVAQEPLIEIDFAENSAIPGQPLTLRVTVLVPTWLPKPVVFPSFEAPNILVQLPDGATKPTSRSIDGETWSGVTRQFRVTPMLPGRVEIPVQNLLVTIAQPGQPDPLERRVALAPLVIEGVVPAAAETLDPFIAAEALRLSSARTDAEMPLAAGDSVTLTVTAETDGVSAIFLPALLPAVQIEGVAAYPAEPVIEDIDNRSKVSGRRIETVTLVAQSGGAGRVADITLDWYNLTTGSVETARLAGFDVVVDAPVAAPVRVDTRQVVLYGVIGLALGLIGLWIYRRLAPKLHDLRARQKQRRAESESWAYNRVKRASQAQDIDRLFRALDVWAPRCAVDPRALEPLQSALSALGSARYGPLDVPQGAAWQSLRWALPSTRSVALRAAQTRHELPPLNPRYAPARRGPA